MPASIYLHDYAGHPFQAELSRELARRGARVTHAFFADDIGPKGDLKRRADDPPGLAFSPISLGESYTKESFVRRRFQDLRYGALVAEEILRLRPDVVMSGNTPTEAQSAIQQAARRVGARFVFWCQDFYSIAVNRILAKRLPIAGQAVGLYYTALERRQMRNADAIVLITEDFAPQALKWGVAKEKLHVIPNWGAIEQIPSLPKDNAWAREHGLTDKFVFLYSGTIGLKHNPALLTALAHRFRDHADVRIVVAASGTGVAQIEAEKSAHRLDNILLPGLQPFERFPEMLASADVLTAVIEREAGAFSVPSKVLSYFCAGRPILLAAPPENLASKNVVRTGAGCVVAPEAESDWLSNAEALMQDPARRQTMGKAGRAYAEDNFEVTRVADRFESVLSPKDPLSRN